MQLTNNTANRISIGSLNIGINGYATVSVDTVSAFGNSELQGLISSGVVTVVSYYTGGASTSTPMDTFVPNATELGHGSTANRPAQANIGQMYYDSTIHKPIWLKSQNPNVWTDATGATV